jgi:hypothetical protein
MFKLMAFPPIMSSRLQNKYIRIIEDIMNASNISALKNMTQEATETLAQTKAEAAKGDPQAIRKLAMLQAAKGGQSQPQPANTVDSAMGKLNAKA